MDELARNTIKHRAAMVAQGICPDPLHASSYALAARWLAEQDVPALLDEVALLRGRVYGEDVAPDVVDRAWDKVGRVEQENARLEAEVARLAEEKAALLGLLELHVGHAEENPELGGCAKCQDLYTHSAQALHALSMGAVGVLGSAKEAEVAQLRAALEAAATTRARLRELLQGMVCEFGNTEMGAETENAAEQFAAWWDARLLLEQLDEADAIVNADTRRR